MRLSTPICGENVCLRTLEAVDASTAYLGWLNDPEINALLEVRRNPPQTTGELADFIVDSNASQDVLLLGIFQCGSHTHVGNIKLGPIDRLHSVAEIGFLVGDRAHWGKGYASQAIRLISDHAFEALGLAKVTAGCYAANTGSQRALLRAGFDQEGRRIAQWLAEGGRQDGLVFGRINPTLSEEM